MSGMELQVTREDDTVHCERSDVPSDPSSTFARLTPPVCSIWNVSDVISRCAEASVMRPENSNDATFCLDPVMSPDDWRPAFLTDVMTERDVSKDWNVSLEALVYFLLLHTP